LAGSKVQQFLASGKCVYQATGGPISECPIYFEYLTVSVIVFNNEIIEKILAVYVKNISNLLIGCICYVSEFS
jgi:hypothetical protein